MEARSDVYARVTSRIVADLEQGVRPWMKPWSTGGGQVGRPLRANGTPYRGVNVLLLWDAALMHGFTGQVWMTYKQAHELGGQVRQGEQGSLVVYANTFTKTTTDQATGEEVETAIPFMKGYTVFNVEQIDGLPEQYQARPEPSPEPETLRDERLERFFAATGATLRHGGDNAYYSPSTDAIQMPPLGTFHHAEGYYATLAHEITHWTRHPARLNRTFGAVWDEASYAKEELVAELGAAFLCADLRITPEVRPDHAAYIASWLEALKRDKRAIFTAAAHAQRAADYLHACQQVEQAA